MKQLEAKKKEVTQKNMQQDPQLDRKDPRNNFLTVLERFTCRKITRYKVL